MRAWQWLGLTSCVVLAGCELAQLPPDVVFRCEFDGKCAQPGYVCGGDNICRLPRDAGTDAGVDAGEEDAGFDAGEEDAGFDAGFDAGMEDAGVDAGMDGGVDAGMDAGCVPGVGTDEPDPLGVDLDCDGFDGELASAVFVDDVNGLDTNSGTRAMPVKTLAHAATLNKAQIYVSTAAQTGSVTLSSAAAIYGGYDATASWARTTTKSVINGRLLANPSDAGRVVLELLEVNAPAASSPGSASVAVTLRGVSSASRITNCRLVGGAGDDGDDGADGPPVNDGNPGGAGRSGATGGDGGLEGPTADCGDAGLAFSGFPGGGSQDNGVGANGEDSSQGGVGGLATVIDGGMFDGRDGGDGVSGIAGLQSTVRPSDPPAGSLGSIVAAQWQGVSLGTWTPAESGRPGGGGGAGGGLISLGGVLVARGGGAGGGGSGGCGARSGTAGQTGGASIALVLFDASPTLADVQLVSGQGGRGGNGGFAGTPGSGGAAGAGALGETIATGIAGHGGRGGAGGNGGPGRQGPGGWGGPVIGMFCGGTSAPVTDGTTTWMTGTPGAGGNGDPNGPAGSQPMSGYSANCP